MLRLLSNVCLLQDLIIKRDMLEGGREIVKVVASVFSHVGFLRFSSGQEKLF